STWPTTVTVLLTDSGCTIRVMPLASFKLEGSSVQCGMSSLASASVAQLGSGTSSSSSPKDSVPPKPLLLGGRLPFGSGVSTTVTRSSGFRYSRATPLPSSTVTAWICRSASSGESNPCQASACDQALAWLTALFLLNSNWDCSERLAASTRSADTPSSSTCRMTPSRSACACFGSAPLANPTSIAPMLPWLNG